MDKSNLHNYQLTACEHILKNNFCGLFLEMGLGKTVAALTAIDILLYEEFEIDNVLVVAPKRVAESVWSDECSKWTHLHRLKVSLIVGNEKQRIEAIKTKAHIYVISRDNFAWLCKLYKKTLLPFDMLVLDELSSFKSHQSKRFKEARVARPQFRRVIGLTATPASNGLIDLWAQMYLLDRGERLEKTITKYRDLYFNPGKTNGAIVFNYILKDFAEQTIHNKVKDICISMKAEDYIELPERVDNYIKINPTEALKKQYKDFEKEKVLELFGHSAEPTEITVVNAAALSNKLLQFANGAVYDENRGVHHVHDLKIDALKELIDDSNGQSILIAWAYRHDLSRLKEALKVYNPRELATINDIADWNAGKIRIMLAHPASAGHGLNLQAGGSIIVWFGLTWSLELYSQFNGRLYRQGQTNRVIIHHLVLAGTHDEDVLRAIEAKDKKQENLIKAVKSKIQKYEDNFRSN